MYAEAASVCDPPRPAVPDEPIIPAIGADGTLFPIGKLKAHQDGTLHLAISVFVFCGSRLLIQQRAASKYHCGGQWANTCCTHPHWNESLDASAARRLQEELGLNLTLVPTQLLDYRAAVSDGLIEHERVQVYRADVPQPDLPFRLDPDEVAAVAWVEVEALKADARTNPDRYAPWFMIYLSRWDELNL